MNATYVFLKGKASWARLVQVDKWGNWQLTLHPDRESMDKINALKEKGLKNQIKRDEDGDFITLRRPQQKMIRGKVVGFAPPEILDTEGNPLRDALIGNGSDVTVKLEVYTFKDPFGKEGVGSRIQSVRVDNLVPYLRPRDQLEGEEKLTRDLVEQPKPMF